MEDKRVIEINGIKMEVDLRTARRVDEFRVGDNVRVLDTTYSNHKITHGVITEFVNFKELPTIIVAVIQDDYYSGTDIKFIHINKETEDYEILPASEEELRLDKARVVDQFNIRIEKKKNEVAELEAKKSFFLRYYDKVFKEEE